MLDPVCNALLFPVVCVHQDRLRADGYRFTGRRVQMRTVAAWGGGCGY
jgi:hypothetical protein